jgi:hypothetical protein
MGKYKHMFSKTSIAKAEKLRVRARLAQEAINGMEFAVTLLRREADECRAEAQRIDPHCREPFGSFGGQPRCPQARLSRDEVKRGHCDVCETNRQAREQRERERKEKEARQLAEDEANYGTYPCCGVPLQKTSYNGKAHPAGHKWDCPEERQVREGKSRRAGTAAADRVLDEHPEIEEAIRQGVREREQLRLS